MPRHLVAVWNPTYGQDVMEAHLKILLNAAREYRAGTCDVDDVYVWWGKVRSPNRMQPLPHLDDILALDPDSEAAEPAETHLYLTDYRSLYVCHLGEVTQDDPREQPDEKDRVPAYYTQEDLSCDCWFLLWDIRRLIADDTASVVHALRNLRNTRYHDRPVSIYGGMVELPLIVTEEEEQRYFDPEDRAYYAGKFWVEFDAERVGLGVMERELRENLFGTEAWEALGPTARSFIATGEKIFRDHRDDPTFDFSAAIVEFSKALEVQCNRVLRQALRGAPDDLRIANIEGRSRDVTGGQPLSLGQLERFIGERKEVVNHLRRTLANGDWFTGSLPQILGSLAETRGPAAHTRRLDRKEADRWRRRLVGVGCTGDLVELATASR